MKLTTTSSVLALWAATAAAQSDGQGPPSDGQGPPSDGQGPPEGGMGGGPGGMGGGISGNVHTDFGFVEDCQPPACGSFTIDQGVIEAAFSKFTNVGTETTFSYCGGWWSENVGADVEVAEDFCTTGAGASQECEEVVYEGVTLTFDSANAQYTIESKNQPLHEAENYCNVDITPPILETDFTNDFSYTRTLTPSNAYRGDITNQVGVAVNGVAIFSPFTGISTVAIHDESLDTNSGHPANGDYHYHGFTAAILDENMEDILALKAHSSIVGIASDGFPIYGPVGYATAIDASSGLKLLTSGYECKSEAGTACTAEEMVQPDNWSYTAGDVDECSGRYGVTPEFPNGVYYYVMTVDNTGYPTFPGLPYCTQAKDDSEESTAGVAPDDSGPQAQDASADSPETFESEQFDGSIDSSSVSLSLIGSLIGSMAVLFMV